jgi:hypothetical protein
MIGSNEYDMFPFAGSFTTFVGDLAQKGKNGEKEEDDGFHGFSLRYQRSDSRIRNDEIFCCRNHSHIRNGLTFPQFYQYHEKITRSFPCSRDSGAW